MWKQSIEFLIFIISSIAKCERLCFDLRKANEKLVVSIKSKYSGKFENI